MVKKFAFCLLLALSSVLCYGQDPEFSQFYANHPVLKATSIAERELRIQICKATAQVLKNGLGMLAD